MSEAASTTTPVRPATDKTSDEMPSHLSQVAPLNTTLSPTLHELLPSRVVVPVVVTL